MNISDWMAARRKAFVAIIGSLAAILAALEIALPAGLTPTAIVNVWDKVAMLAAAVTALVYYVPNKAEDPDKTQPSRRFDDGSKFYSWLPLPLFVVLCLFMMSGCAPDTKPVGTKEEALTALGISIEQLAIQTRRLHEQGSIDAGERALAKSHLQKAIDAGVAAGHAIRAGNDAGFHQSIQAAQAALSAVRSILRSYVSDSSHHPYRTQGA